MYLARGDDVREEKSAGQRPEPRRTRRGVLLEGSRRAVRFRLTDHGQESAESALGSCSAGAPKAPSHPIAHQNPQTHNNHPQQPAATCLAPYTNFAQPSRPLHLVQPTLHQLH